MKENIIGLVVIILLIVGGIFGIVSINEKIEVRHKNAFNGWVKYTGNPKNLTYDEWRALKSSASTEHLITTEKESE